LRDRCNIGEAEAVLLQLCLPFGCHPVGICGCISPNSKATVIPQRSGGTSFSLGISSGVVVVLKGRDFIRAASGA
jgi:hypothetical protein